MSTGAGRKQALTARVIVLMVAGLVAAVLAWQIIRQALVIRSPPAIALMAAPDSPQALGRAAEDEFARGRVERAGELARDSLRKAPFNVRALRIAGLAVARTGELDRADNILTLAGNWSLRDDPAHAWLMENRLRRGDFNSAFAHADTLARRRGDLLPQLFDFFNVAAASGPRGLDALARLLAARPPWREAYMTSLLQTDDGLSVAANLALAMKARAQPFSVAELEAVYGRLLAKGRLPALQQLRVTLDRPPASDLLVDGDFDDSEAPAPFGWQILQGSGFSAEIFEEGGSRALRAQYGGVAMEPVVQQLLFLPGGRYTLTGRVKTEVGDENAGARLEWTVVCLQSGEKLSSVEDVSRSGGDWQDVRVSITSPGNCSAQWLRLTPKAGLRRRTVVMWYDDLELHPASAEIH